VFTVVAAATLVATAALFVKLAADRNRSATGGPALRARVDLH
jgi:AAHS family 4-hydroxybenzoate transporter-like MFS transporter